jgi:hypothetical protein
MKKDALDNVTLSAAKGLQTQGQMLRFAPWSSPGREDSLTPRIRDFIYWLFSFSCGSDSAPAGPKCAMA